VNLSAISGMRAAVQLLDRTATQTANFAAAPDTGALTEHVTNLMTASIAYDVNARVLQSQDETTQAAIDLIA
jgi:flagellar basal body rod protein FlgC